MNNRDKLHQLKSNAHMPNAQIALVTGKSTATVNRWTNNDLESGTISDKDLEKVQLLHDLIVGDKKVIFYNIDERS